MDEYHHRFHLSENFAHVYVKLAFYIVLMQIKHLSTDLHIFIQGQVKYYLRYLAWPFSW